MANNYTEIMKIVNQGNKMGLSNTITRDNGIPLDLSSVQESYNAAVIYAATKAIAYQGQLIAAEGVVYIIVAESQGQVEIDGVTYENYLKPVGTIPGFDTANNDTLPQLKIDENGNRTLEWVSISAIVEGDGNSVTTLVPLDKSVTIADTAEDGFEGHKYTVKVNVSAEEGNSLILKDDGLFVAVPEIVHPEYAVKADERVEGATSTTYHLTKDGENVDVAIVVPDAYNDEALDTRLTVVEGTVGDHETRLGKVEDFFKTAEGESLNEALDTLAEIQKEIAADDASAASMLASINANTTAIEKLNGSVTTEGSVAKAVADAEARVAETYATKQMLTDHSNTMDGKLAEYAKTADVNNELAKKVENATIAHTSEGVAEGVTKDGTTLKIVVDAYTKEETLTKIQEKITEINGGESAGEVLGQLNSYKETNDAAVAAINGKIGTPGEGQNDEGDTLYSLIASAQTQADKGVADAKTANDAIAALTNGTVATNTSDITAIKGRLDTLETAKGNHESRLGIAEGKITALEAEDKTINETLGTIAGQITALQGEDSRLAGLIAANTTEIGKKANSADVYTKGEVDTKVQEAIDAIPEVDFTPYLKSEDAAKTYATITALEAEAATARAAEKANADAIAVLVGAVEGDNAKSVRTIAAEEVAAIVDKAPEDFDTLKEIAEYIASDKTNAAEINNKLAAHSTILAGIGGEGEKATVVAYVTDAIAAIEFPEYTLPAATAEVLGGVKLSDEIGVNENGQLKVTKVTTDVLTNGAEEFVLNGGNASGANNA